MILMKYSTIFRSRWWALVWAVGIIWFALDVAGDGDGPAGNGGKVAATDVTGAPVTDEQTREIAKAIEGL